MISAREKLTNNLRLLNEAVLQIPRQEPTGWIVVYFLVLFSMIAVYAWPTVEWFYFSITWPPETQIYLMPNSFAAIQIRCSYLPHLPSVS